MAIIKKSKSKKETKNETEEATLKFVSEEEYLKKEVAAETKSEYDNGKIVAMAGAKLNHNRIVRNLVRILGNCTVDKECEVFANDLLVHLPECKKYVYPDVVTVCGEIEIADKPKNGLDVLLNPQIVIEVSSKSTAGYDLGEKMECYLKLKSLKEYIVISSEQQLIIVYKKDESNQILLKIYKEEQEIQIGNCKLAIKDIYNKVVSKTKP